VWWMAKRQRASPPPPSSGAPPRLSPHAKLWLGLPLLWPGGRGEGGASHEALGATCGEAGGGGARAGEGGRQAWQSAPFIICAARS